MGISSKVQSPKRSSFRFHLSTAITMMVAVSGFVGANVNPRHTNVNIITGVEDSQDKSRLAASGYVYGWPMMITSQDEYWRADITDHNVYRHNFGWHFWSLLLDLLIGLVALACTSFVSEYIIRRGQERYELNRKNLTAQSLF